MKTNHRTYEKTEESYSIQVWDGKKYIDWGIPYNTEKEAVAHFIEYLDSIKTMDCEHWRKEYETYISQPYKVECVVKKIKVQEETTTKNYIY